MVQKLFRPDYFETGSRSLRPWAKRSQTPRKYLEARPSPPVQKLETKMKKKLS